MNTNDIITKPADKGGTTVIMKTRIHPRRCETVE